MEWLISIGLGAAAVLSAIAIVGGVSYLLFLILNKYCPFESKEDVEAAGIGIVFLLFFIGLASAGFHKYIYENVTPPAIVEVEQQND